MKTTKTIDYYGDAEIEEEHYPKIEKELKSLKSLSNDELLVLYDAVIISINQRACDNAYTSMLPKHKSRYLQVNELCTQIRNGEETRLGKLNYQLDIDIISIMSDERLATVYNK